MKKVEEFKETQKLIDEFKSLGDKIPDLDNKIAEIENQMKVNERRANDRIERLEEEMQPNEEDEKFGLDRESVEAAYNKRIDEAKKELYKQNGDLTKDIENLNDEKKELEDSKKFFRTDDHLRTITMEIEAMKKEVKSGELELKKKDVELEEFYQEEEHDNPIRWQEIYNEKDAIKKDIDALNAKIEEYSKFKEELESIHLTAEEYKTMYKREQEKLNEKVEEDEPEKVEEEKVDKSEFINGPTRNLVDEFKIEREDEESSTEKVDPETSEKGSTTDTPKKTTPRKFVPKLKIVINENGIQISAGNKKIEDASIAELRDFEWDKESIQEWLPGIKSEENLENVDLNLLTALTYIHDSGVYPKEAASKIIKQYENMLKSNNKEEAAKFKDMVIINYDRTNLDYLKPSNIIKRIRNKKDYDLIRADADYAKEMGFATITPDQPGRIRQFFSNMKTKLLPPGKDDRTVIDRIRDSIEQSDKEYMTDDEIALEEAMEAYRQGKIDTKGTYKASIDKTKKEKIGDFKDKLKYQSKEQRDNKAWKELKNKERANAFARHESIVDKSSKTKDNDAER